MFAIVVSTFLLQATPAQTVKAADAAMTAADFAGALKLLESISASAASPAEFEAAALLRAECLLALQRPAEVDAAFADALTVNPSATLGANAAPKLVAALARVKARMIGTLSIQSNLPGAMAKLDGKRIGPLPLTVPVIAGKHLLEGDSPELKSNEEVLVFAGKTTEVTLQRAEVPVVVAPIIAPLPPVPSAGPSKVLPITLIAAGLGASVVGGVLLGTSFSWNANGALNDVQIDRAKQLHEGAQGRHDAGIGVLAVGATAAVAGLVVLLLTPSASTVAVVAPTRDGAVVGIAGRF